MTALRKLGGPVFALACDLPFMDDAHISRLLAARENRPRGCVLTAWRLENSDFFENLVAIYEPEALPLLEDGVSRNFYKLGRLVPPELRHCLTYTEAERHVFFNVNYPDDLQRLRKTSGA
jgi:molybdopterin-guanine dinucleotide biosynthesis protein A